MYYAHDEIRPLWVFWVSGPVCQPKAFQLKWLKSLRVSFSSCLLSRVGFTSEQFSSVLMNLVSFKNPAPSQLVSLSHLYSVFTSNRWTPAVHSRCQSSLIKAEKFTNIPRNQCCDSFGLLTHSYQHFSAQNHSHVASGTLPWC